LYKHIMRVALESDDEVMRTAVMNIHEKKAYNAFRISNGWVHECSAKASQMLNATYVCYAPSFCCVNASKPLLDGACPPLKWDGIGKLNPSRAMYQYPCTRRIVSTYRNKMMNIMLFSLMTALVAIVCGLHLYFWRDSQKSQQSSASQMKSPEAVQPAPPTK
uniref:Tetraspanin-2 n=1 Tax=Heligmosomoides polygyrus TaxID=6339 RepID=A0A183G0Q9_HELPZ